MKITLEDAIKAYQHCEWENRKWPTPASAKALAKAKKQVEQFGPRVWKIGYTTRQSHDLIFKYHAVNTCVDAICACMRDDPNYFNNLYSECVFGWRN